MWVEGRKGERKEMEKRKEGREKESYMKEKEGRKKVSKGGSRTENVLTLKKLEEGEGKTK